MATLVPAHKHAVFMREMMEHLGIDPGVRMAPQWSLSYMTALHRCEDCAHKQDCRARLHDVVPAAPPRFSPNADIFHEMLVDQPGPHCGDQPDWIH